jgi:cytoskeletal protein CcmA (bactofilin family)
MGRIKLFVIVIVVMIFGISWTVVAHAEGAFQSGGTVTIAKGQVYDQTLFVAGQTLDIAGTVNGDVFCAGQSVTISGTVNGDVFCAGQSIAISGVVSGSVRVAGQAVLLSGTITQNASALGQTIDLVSPAQISGDFSVGGNITNIAGSIGRDLLVGSSTLAVDGNVGRDIQSEVGTLTLSKSARVTGKVTYTSRNDLVQDEGAVVSGVITKHLPSQTRSNQTSYRGAIIGSFYMFIALLFIALVAVLLVPSTFQLLTTTATNEPFKTLAFGFIASLLVPAVLFVLALTFVGIPLAAVGLVTWIVVCCIAWLFAAYYLGRLLLHGYSNNSIWYMLLGTVIILMLYAIPVIGIFVWLITLWFGLGMIANRILHSSRPQYVINKD